MDHKIERKPAFRVAGRRKVTEYAGGMWAIVKADNQKGIREMEEVAGAGNVTLGFCFGFDEAGHNDNMVGFLADGKDVSGYDVFDFPEANWAVLDVSGKISDNVLWKAWQYIHGDLLSQGKLVQLDGLPTIEDYLEWDEEKDSCHVIINVAVK